jgi:hypothetical protein
METIILLLHFCLPNDGETQCLLVEEQMNNQQMCEQKVEELNQDFMDLDVFNASCERSSYES